jgi:CheY-like chemotaxis protein
MNDHLTKPFSPEALAAMVLRWLRPEAERRGRPLEPAP